MANVLLTGASGMIGKGILLECLDNEKIDSVTLIGRSSIDIKHPKIREILLKDFADIYTIKDKIGPIDACFHCMGVSVLGLSEEQYTKLTFDVTRKLADVCFEVNPQMTFNYVSGEGTDSSEKGRQMWARVKGKTENYILSKGFGKNYMFRPGFIIPEKGIKSRTKLYNRAYAILRPFFSMMRKMKKVTTTTRIGHVMIRTALEPAFDNVYLDNKTINSLAQAHSA